MPVTRASSTDNAATPKGFMLQAEIDYSFNALSTRPMTLLSLPAEVRNMITHFVIRSGDVHPPAKVIDASEKADKGSHSDILRWESVEKRHRHPGIGYLATCRQIYAEAYSIFYSSNTFYLPRGPILGAALYFDHLTPSHLAQLQHVAVRLSLADITKVVRVEYLSIATDWYCRFFNELASQVRCIWQARLLWAYDLHNKLRASRGQGLATVTLEAPFTESLKLSGEEFHEALCLWDGRFGKLFDLWVTPMPKGSDSLVANFFRNAYHRATAYAVRRTLSEGWGQNCDWLQHLPAKVR